MKRYSNKKGNSGIVNYELGKQWIVIGFRDTNDFYLYDYQNPGQSKVEEMKKLAVAGKGLATFINQFVRNNYAVKIPSNDLNSFLKKLD
jgi:hypothetical protein